VFGLVGWYYPRYLIAQETTIASKPAPYQQTAAGDVILDFTLNEPVVDPPTIPCTYTVVYYYYYSTYLLQVGKNNTRDLHLQRKYSPAFTYLFYNQKQQPPCWCILRFGYPWF
jgi:hypothetical protein